MARKFNRTDNLIRSMKSRPEIKTPISTDMFLPNHSGIAIHPEAKKSFIRKDVDDATTGNLSMKKVTLTPDGSFTAGNAQIYSTAADGLTMVGKSGTSNDFVLAEGGGLTLFRNPTGTNTCIFPSGPIDMNTHKITNVVDPTANQEVATKKYVDDTIPPISIRSASITVEDPDNTEDITIFYTSKAITISEMRAVLRGSDTPSVTWTIRHNVNRTSTGYEVVTSGTTTTNTTTGEDITTFNDATIPADSFVWFKTTAQSGTVTEFHVTMVFTED